jgi:hypothetical protein
MTQNNVRANRLILLSIIGLPVTMILAATWLWVYVSSGELDLVSVLGTSNHGRLLDPPKQVGDYHFENQFGAKVEITQTDPKWTFVVRAEGQCDVDCMRALYTTRQIHTGLGKEFGRIRRVFVSAESQQLEASLPPQSIDAMATGVTTFGDYLETYHKGMPVLKLAPAEYKALFGDAPNSEWFLVDPAGWVMMSYSLDTHYKDITSDLKFLLKNSAG